jgi:hypothetical protein
MNNATLGEDISQTKHTNALSERIKTGFGDHHGEMVQVLISFALPLLYIGWLNWVTSPYYCTVRGVAF